MSKRPEHFRIPDPLLITALKQVTADARCNCDNFDQYQWELVRFHCGPQWAGVPLFDVVRHGNTLRKNGKVGKIEELRGDLFNKGPAQYS